MNLARKMAIFTLVTVAASGFAKLEFSDELSDPEFSWVMADSDFADTQADKNISLQLLLSGESASSEEIVELKSYYEQVTLDYVCQRSEFNTNVEQGVQINLQIKYENKSDILHNQLYVSKSQCNEQLASL